MAWFVIVAGEAASLELSVPIFRLRANRVQRAAVNRNMHAASAAQLARYVPPDFAEVGARCHGMYGVHAAGFQDTYSLLKSNDPVPTAPNAVVVYQATSLFHPTEH